MNAQVFVCLSQCLCVCLCMPACAFARTHMCTTMCMYYSVCSISASVDVLFMVVACLYWQPMPAPSHPAEVPRPEEVLGSFVNKAPGLSVSQPKCRPFLLRITRGTEGRPLPLGTVTQIQHTTTSSPGARGRRSLLPLSLTPGHRT
jgi:hypothetical protein